MTQTATIKSCCGTCENFLAGHNACEGLPEGDQPFRPVCFVRAESHTIVDPAAFGVGDQQTHQCTDPSHGLPRPGSDTKGDGQVPPRLPSPIHSDGSQSHHDD